MTRSPKSQPDAKSTIAGYLSVMEREMRGRISLEAQSDLLGETEFWLEKQTNDFILQGQPVNEAVTMAIKRHGSPKPLALMLCEQWYESEVDSPIFRTFGRANTVAGTIFGIGNLASIVALQILVLWPSDSARLPFSPAVIRSVLPQPLPLPELSWQFILPVAMALGAPVVLGALVGTLLPTRAFAAVYRIMCPIILSAFLLGCLLLPNTTGLFFALLQTAFWLPVGCLTAHLSSFRARRRRAGTKKEGSTAGPRTPGSNPIGAT